MNIKTALPIDFKLDMMILETNKFNKKSRGSNYQKVVIVQDYGECLDAQTGINHCHTLLRLLTNIVQEKC